MASLKSYNVDGKHAKLNRFMPIESSKNKAVACWGWKKGKPYFNRGFNVLVFERGYLGDRFHWTSVAWNGLNGRADFALPEDVTMDRFNKHFELKPWKDDGKNIIIMGQVRGDASLQGKDLTSFYEKAAKELKNYYNKPVYFRPHPVSVKNGYGFKPSGIAISKGNLMQELSDAFLVVTYNSNAAVDAVVNGIPALSFDHGSMAFGVTGHSMKERIMPEREKWAARLAWCQWSPEEIARGDFWERMAGYVPVRPYREKQSTTENRSKSFIRMLEART